MLNDENNASIRSTMASYLKAILFTPGEGQWKENNSLNILS